MISSDIPDRGCVARATAATRPTRPNESAPSCSAGWQSADRKTVFDRKSLQTPHSNDFGTWSFELLWSSCRVVALAETDGRLDAWSFAPHYRPPTIDYRQYQCHPGI